MASCPEPLDPNFEGRVVAELPRGDLYITSCPGRVVQGRFVQGRDAEVWVVQGRIDDLFAWCFSEFIKEMVIKLLQVSSECDRRQLQSPNDIDSTWI